METILRPNLLHKRPHMVVSPVTPRRQPGANPLSLKRVRKQSLQLVTLVVQPLLVVPTCRLTTVKPTGMTWTLNPLTSLFLPYTIEKKGVGWVLTRLTCRFWKPPIT